MITEDQKQYLAAAQKAVQANEIVDTQIALGEAYFDIHDYENAITAFERALALDAQCTTALNRLGHTYYRLRKPDQAIDAYERSIAINPQQENPYYGLGVLNSSQIGDYEAAVHAYERGLAANPGNAFFVACLGNAYAHQSKTQKAIELLTRSIEMQADNPYAMRMLSIVYLRQGAYDRVVDLGHKLLASNAEDHNAERMLGYAYTLAGEEAKALVHLERAIDLDPNDFEVRALLSRMYRAQGMTDKADHAYQLAVETAAEEQEYGAAAVALLTGNIDVALPLLQTALDEGQLTKGWARVDPEFAFMQNDPRFVAMIA